MADRKEAQDKSDLETSLIEVNGDIRSSAKGDLCEDR